MLKHTKTRLLIVEDDDALAELMEEYLSMHLFELFRISSGEEVVQAIQEKKPHVVLLDLMLPGLNGLDVCRQIRGTFSGAIMMLTASQSEADHVAGLELGADDFVTKPIEPRILLARIRTQLRRLQEVQRPMPPDLSSALTTGFLDVHLASRSVRVKGKDVPLTTMEFDILAMLAKHVGSVVNRDDLYMDVLGVEYNGIDRGLDVHVSRIRRKLHDAGFDASRIKSVRAVGYLLAHV